MPSMAFTPPYVPAPRAHGVTLKVPPAVQREQGRYGRYSVACYWCGKVWRRRVRTYRQAVRFLRSHVPTCQRKYRQKVSA